MAISSRHLPAYISNTKYETMSGTLTFTGTLGTNKIYAIVITGILTFAGSLINIASMILSGTLTSSGVLTNVSNKVLSGVLTSSGSLIRDVSKLLVGALTFSGSLIKVISKIFTGILSFLGIVYPVKLIDEHITLQVRINMNNSLELNKDANFSLEIYP